MKTKKGRKVTHKFKPYIGYKVEFFKISDVDIKLTGHDCMKFVPTCTCGIRMCCNE